MTKRKKAKPDMTGEELPWQKVEEVEGKTEEVTEEVKPEPVPAPKGILEEHFILGNWKGFPNYSCKYCPWAGIEEVRVKDHYIDKHMRPVQSSPEGSKLYDRFGNKN